MPLAKSDPTKTMRFKDGAAWLVLRTQINAGERDTINDLNSRTRISGMAAAVDGTGEAFVEQIPNSREVNRTLFDILAVEWSLDEEKPVARDYDELTKEAADWVDECIREAVAAGRNGRAEGNSSRSSSAKRTARKSSRKPAASRTSSPAGAE